MTKKKSKRKLTSFQINMKKKMCFIYTIKHYSAIKKNEIIPFAATWVDLQIFNLSKSEREKTSIT